MIKNKIIFSLFVLFFYTNSSAQILEGYESSTIPIEVKKGVNKKAGTGYFFGLTTAKDMESYSVIVVNKEVIKDSENIQLFFTNDKINETDKPEIFIHTIPNNKEYVYSAPDTENNLAFIFMAKIYNQLEKKDINTSEVYLMPNYIEILKLPISEKELFQLKESWEKQLVK